jgi:hypothetical protein
VCGKAVAVASTIAGDLIRTMLTSQPGGFARMRSLVVGDFLDPDQAFQHSPLGDLKPGCDHLAMQKRQKRQCEDTLEMMNVDHLTGPVKSRIEADQAWIFHVIEKYRSTVFHEELPHRCSCSVVAWLR